MTLCLVVLGRHVRHLEFFDVLLGDRPALTPIETFCQLLLAGNPDEIVQQAESLLETRSLLSYYDDVALKGLQLLAHSFWACDDKFLNDPSAQRMSGGDVFVSSLRDAVNECLTIAHGEAIGTDAAHKEGAAL